MPLEIHPETPKEGKLIKDALPHVPIDGMKSQLNMAGKPYNITFGDFDRLSNTKDALIISEFAKDKGQFECFHTRLFEAYFVEGLDIGNLDILKRLGEECNLNASEMESALTNPKYAKIIEETNEEARKLGATGTPTFIINNKYRVVGAQPYENFVEILKKIQNNEV
ncbi:putative DsbA family dithiol-disulfide isomerase [Salirhabdus euzebyi]|uniref:Putative DsbA family dithiol-disulfide isomerase n=2 Tax=Salirhabdus euzebyi TaxID=394506 RepID=A0A841Q8M6_9BACI|nr:putative DsbA family dithiol-disulfide isomerase [Salirhabdus euzebyi]